MAENLAAHREMVESVVRAEQHRWGTRANPTTTTTTRTHAHQPDAHKPVQTCARTHARARATPPLGIACCRHEAALRAEVTALRAANERVESELVELRTALRQVGRPLKQPSAKPGRPARVGASPPTALGLGGCASAALLCCAAVAAGAAADQPDAAGRTREDSGNSQPAKAPHAK
jgi:hypothetical protein